MTLTFIAQKHEKMAKVEYESILSYVSEYGNEFVFYESQMSLIK